MKILYFAWLRTRRGLAEEEVSPPPGISTVAELLAWLKDQGPGQAAALSDLSAVRVAVNQDYARAGDKVSASDEVALFPPVTGGGA